MAGVDVLTYCSVLTVVVTARYGMKTVSAEATAQRMTTARLAASSYYCHRGMVLRSAEGVSAWEAGAVSCGSRYFCARNKGEVCPFVLSSTGEGRFTDGPMSIGTVWGNAGSKTISVQNLSSLFSFPITFQFRPMASFLNHSQLELKTCGMVFGRLRTARLGRGTT